MYHSQYPLYDEIWLEEFCTNFYQEVKIIDHDRPVSPTESKRKATKKKDEVSLMHALQ